MYGKRASENVKREQPIGVFDSGLGGVSVLRELVSLLPAEDFIYFGDAAHAPYGERSEREIRALTTAQVDRMAAAGVKAVVLACNTATSAACAPLRRRYRGMPIIGMEPALKPAILSGNRPRVVVMATHATLRQKKFARLMERFKEAGEIVKLPCPEIVEFVERGEVRGTLTHSPRGEGGFGYDPIFVPEGFEVTTAQMSAEQKNAISHRGIAFRALMPYIVEYLRG